MKCLHVEEKKKEGENWGKHNGGDDTMRRLKALLKDY